jgi:acyl dehydratase
MSDLTANKRLPAEELPVGELLHLGSHTVTEEEIIGFAQQWDPQYFHVDPEAAANSEFGGIIASGIHTAAIFQRLCVENFFNRYDIIAGREVSQLRFERPVFAGTALHGRVTINSVKPAGPGRALFSSTGTLVDNADRQVLSVVLDALIRSRTQSE